MSTKHFFFRLFFRPITDWAVRRALVGRNRSPREPGKGRFMEAEVNRLLDQSWRAFDELVPDVSREPTLGSRLNVRLAALTLAMFRSLTAAGIKRDYAIELIGDTCWMVYQYWGRLGLLARSLSRSQEPAKRVRKDGTWPVMFPFNYPGYIARYVPTEKGIGFDMVRCPVAEYFRAHDAGDVAANTWRMLDYGIAEMVGNKLVRTRTLAAGDPQYDFR
jgi:hypothetical protein